MPRVLSDRTLLQGPYGIQQSKRRGAVCQCSGPNHGHKRNNARTARDQLDRLRLAGCATRTIHQLGLALRFHRRSRVLASNRERPLRLGNRSTVISTLPSEFGAEAMEYDRTAVYPSGAVNRTVDMLARDVTWPITNCKGECPRRGRLIMQIKNPRGLPLQSSEYRCSRHGSP